LNVIYFLFPYVVRERPMELNSSEVFPFVFFILRLLVFAINLLQIWCLYDWTNLLNTL
jgi:hypothetical protein